MKYWILIKASVEAFHRRLYSNMAGTFPKPQVYVTRTLNEEAINILKQSCEVTTWSGIDPVPRTELLKNLPDKQALLCLLTDKIDAEVLDSAQDLKVIATMSVGYDHLDVKEIIKRNIKIGYTPDVLTDATAELTVGLLLATSRRLIQATNAAKSGEWKSWSPFWMCGPGLRNATVGIVGFGRIGQEVAKRLKPFNIKNILYASRSAKPEALEIGAQHVNFQTLCSESDFVIVACALNSETKDMFNRETFKIMKPSCIFINTSRGGVVDQDALIDALKNKTIYAAGIDVTVPEPLPLDSPLFQLDNCIVLPHIGSASLDTRKIMADLSVRNILAGLMEQEMPAELKI